MFNISLISVFQLFKSVFQFNVEIYGWLLKFNISYYQSVFQ